MDIVIDSRRPPLDRSLSPGISSFSSIEIIPTPHSRADFEYTIDALLEQTRFHDAIHYIARCLPVRSGIAWVFEHLDTAWLGTASNPYLKALQNWLHGAELKLTQDAKPIETTNPLCWLFAAAAWEKTPASEADLSAESISAAALLSVRALPSNEQPQRFREMALRAKTNR